MAKATRYISVRNWRKFQHYDPEKRTPPWIKNMTELMSSDDYLGLSAPARGVLHGIWMEYARSRCELPGDTLTLSRRLGMKVLSQTLVSLNHAGFIDFVASKTLAEGYQAASARVRATETETEEEKEVEKEQTPPTHTRSKTTGGPSGETKNGTGGWEKVGDTEVKVETGEEIPF
jgi:hypothetical protein